MTPMDLSLLAVSNKALQYAIGLSLSEKPSFVIINLQKLLQSVGFLIDFALMHDMSNHTD